MSKMKIGDECISCNACEDSCQNNAIFEAGQVYTVSGVEHAPVSLDHTYIAPELCNGCGACADTCKGIVDCIVEYEA